jgi:hypothetical protein
MSLSRPAGYASPAERDSGGSPVWQRAVTRLVVTDLAYFWGNNRDDEEAENEYARQARRHLRLLHRAGVFVAEGWNLFASGHKWEEEFPGAAAPRLVLLSGTWNNPCEDDPQKIRGSGGGDVHGQEFLRLGVAALRADFPGALVVTVQAAHHLEFCAELGSCCYPLKAGHGVTMLCPPDAEKISQPQGLGAVCAGRTRPLQPYVVDAPNPANPGGDHEELDVMGLLTAILRDGGSVLQLGANRAQFMVAFLDHLSAAWTQEEAKFAAVEVDARPAPQAPPPPVRVHWESKLGVLLSFTYRDLITHWSREEPHHLVAYWCDSYPASLATWGGARPLGEFAGLHRQPAESDDAGAAAPTTEEDEAMAEEGHGGGEL